MQLLAGAIVAADRLSYLVVARSDLGFLEQGVAVHYNIEVTQRLHITRDLQVIIHPGGDNDVAIVYGIRARMSS